jgi:hypothetical protein
LANGDQKRYFIWADYTRGKFHNGLPCQEKKSKVVIFPKRSLDSRRVQADPYCSWKSEAKGNDSFDTPEAIDQN